ncbi:hypothetical protein JOQ06_027988, partial [Pogonophryne albipinna]
MAMLLCGDVDSGPLKGEPAGGSLFILPPNHPHHKLQSLPAPNTLALAMCPEFNMANIPVSGWHPLYPRTSRCRVGIPFTPEHPGVGLASPLPQNILVSGWHPLYPRTSR